MTEMRAREASSARSRKRLRSELEAILTPRGLRRIHSGDAASHSPAGTSPAPWARVMVIVRGRQAMGISRHGEVTPVVLQKSDALYLVPNAWWKPDYGKDYTVFGIVFIRDYVRFLINTHRAVEGHTGAECWYHTSGPLRRAAQRIVLTLNELVTEEGNDATVADLLRALLRMSFDQLITDEPAPGGKAKATWQAICEYVWERPSEPIDRNTVADAFGLHPNHVSRLFKQFGPEGFNPFLRRVRMQRAATLLRESNETIDAVSAECGYTNSTYFISQFGKYFGVSPGRYRRGRT